MAAQANEQPIIIKRKKKGGGDGHHGGAWKVAYADFVTAMMAFFMLMWLLNATTEQQRMGLADYFAPSIAVNRISGGGDGAFGGDSVFSEETLAQNGTGASSEAATESNAARGLEEDEQANEALSDVENELRGKSGESEVADEVWKHIITKVTDEGLVVDLVAFQDARLFKEGTAEPTPLLRSLAVVIANASKMVTNNISIGGHVPSEPIVKQDVDLWALSAQQATAMRELLENARMAPTRIERVSGHANREPTQDDPLDIRNNRLEVIFLR